MLHNAINQASGPVPVALAVWKRGRWCIVAKLTHFNDGNESILAITHRRQVGTQTMISVPVAVVNYAETRGIRVLYYRNDRQGTMRCISLSDLKGKGYLRPSEGVPEYFIKIADMRPTLWREWKFVDDVVELSNDRRDRPAGQQLPLW